MAKGRNPNKSKKKGNSRSLQNVADKKKSNMSVPTKPMGMSGVEVSEGQIENNDTQKEMLGIRGLKKIRAMAMDDEIAWTSYWVYSYLMQSAELCVKPASDNASDKAAAEFIEGVSEDMTRSIKSSMGEIATMIRDGFAPLEILWKQRLGINLEDFENSSKFNDGKWGLKKLALRGQMTVKEGAWIGLESGDWTAILQVLPDGSEKVIDRKYILNFTTAGDVDSNPEGISLLRGMHRPSKGRHKLENSENIGHSRTTKGTLNIKVPPEILRTDATQDQKEMYSQAKKMARNYHVDEQGSFISPMMYDDNNNPLYELEVLNGGTGGSDISPAIQRRMMTSAMTTFTDWLLLGHDSGGNRSLSGDRYNLMLRVINTQLQRVADTLNTELVPKLLLINNIPVTEGIPKFAFSSLEKADVESIAKVIKDLTLAGQDFSDEPTESFFRTEMGIPEREENGSKTPPTKKKEEKKSKKEDETTEE